MEIKDTIQNSLKDLEKGDLLEHAIGLFKSLNYKSENLISNEIYDYNATQKFIKDNLSKELSRERCLGEDWSQFQFLFQFSPEDIGNEIPSVENLTKRIESFLFVALELKKNHYTRTQLVSITRELNKPFQMPVIVLFRYGLGEKKATLSVIDRRKSKSKNPEKAIENVLEKVSLIHNIRLKNPHRAHVDILFDLHLSNLRRNFEINNFIQLYDAWQKVFDLKLLNKRFYEEIFHWYLWANKIAEFPNIKIVANSGRKKEKYFTDEKDIQNHTSVSLIRLLTRILFVWFLKEKGLVPEEFFDVEKLKNILKSFQPSGQKVTYYKAILQNLFFATLNTERNENGKKNRKFASDSKEKAERRREFQIKNLYRHKDAFSISETEILKKFSEVPFLNGGLFECLDKDLVEDVDGEFKTTHYVYLDGFSREDKYSAKLPDVLFFGQSLDVDLNEELGEKRRRNTPVDGLIQILNKYKFTIEENTPLEEDVALDPELLGKVFENLLAAYNPETSTTARKQTGSFYTPREIVEYMVDESLKAYIKTNLTQESLGHNVLGTKDNTMFSENEVKKGQMVFTTPLDSNTWKGREEQLEENLKTLFDSENTNPFSPEDTGKIIESIYKLKALDPACGSGAFPMGILNRLVQVLTVLDPNNKLWQKIQLDYLKEEAKLEISKIEESKEIAKGISIKEAKDAALKALEEKKQEVLQSFEKHLPNYARKLYLIENCIYGVDIQPIAVQISKLRFFISLIIDQSLNEEEPNRGILSLPNLETKFVAANALIGLDLPKDTDLIHDDEFKKTREEIKNIRHLYFQAKHRDNKTQLIRKEKLIRTTIRDRIVEKDLKKIDDLISKIGTGKQGKDAVHSLNKIKEKRSIQPTEIHEIIKNLPSQFDVGIKKKLLEDVSKFISTKSAEQIASWDPYNQNSSAEWFDQEFMFGLSEGFDVVIGNPPYGVSIKNEYRKSVIKSLGKVPDFEIYYFFIRFAYKSCKLKGINTYIIPNTILFNHFAKNFRLEILERWNIGYILDCTTKKLFDGATVYNIIYIFSKADSPIHNVRFKKLEESENLIDFLARNPSSIDKKILFENNVNWGLVFKLDKNITDILRKIKNNTIECISIYNEISQGLIAYDKYQGQSQDTIINRVFHFNTKSKPGLKKWLWGEDITRYSVVWNEKEYIDYCDGLANPREPKYFHNERLLVREITNPRIYSTITSEELYNDPSILIVLSNKNNSVKLLLSIINSILYTFFHFNHSPKATKGGFPKILIEDLKKLPIPKSPIENPELQKPLINLVDKILKAKDISQGGSPTADTSKWESEIDARVFHLYGLSEEEMNTVLDSFPKMEDNEKNLIRKFYKELE